MRVSTVATKVPDTGYKGRIPGSLTIKRERRDIHVHWASLGPGIFRRMYRMHEVDLMHLFDLIQPNLPPEAPRTRGCAPNGEICKLTRLAMAIRLMAGGDKHDIHSTHGTGEGEPMISLWMVVDAINATQALDLVFPQTHQQQLAIAAEFESKSKCAFNNCVGAMDGMLVWTNMPSKGSNELGVGPTKHFCGRKKKYGLNMQGTCDARRRFLDIYINHPGSASDFAVWLSSPLRRQVETPGFLAPNLVIYGDNAYINATVFIDIFHN